ncbi:MAG: hypothetical protein U0821_08885 [Chloroflexota bacterium]
MADSTPVAERPSGTELYRVLLVAALSSFALTPLMTDHFFASSDGLYHVYRSMEVYRCLQSGVLICRWMPDQFLGYGTPLLNLYSPAVYYYIAGLHALGFGWIAATKASMVLFIIFAGVAAYGYASDFLSPRAAVLAAVVYVYVPYHLVNAYFRGDLPELFAMAWFPAILWAFTRIVRPGPPGQRAGYVAAAALCYAGLILTHNLSAFIYTGLLVIYCAFLLLRGLVERQYRLPLGLLKPAGLLLGATFLAYALSAYLSFPALFERHLIQLEGLLYVSHADHFPTLQQIMPNQIVHIYGIIFPESPEYAYKMGLVQVGLGGLGAVVAVALYRRFRFRARGEAAISIVVFAVAFWFSRPVSLWAWDNIPLLPYAQFPWRMLLLMALPTSVMTGFIVDAFAERWRPPLATALVAFTILTNTLGLRPIMANAVEGEIDLAESTRFELMYKLLGTTVAGEYIPRWVKEKPFVSPEALAIVLGGISPAVHVPTSDPRISVERLAKGSNHQEYRLKGDVAGRVVFSTAYFPGWVATLDGKPAEIDIIDPEGLIALHVGPGEHLVRLDFGNTPIRTWGEVVSAVALVVCAALLCWWGWSAWRPVTGISLDRRLAMRTGLVVGILALFPVGVWLYQRAYRPPSVAQRALKINLGDTLMLLGYDLRVNGALLERTHAVPSGTTLQLATYWQGISLDADRVARSRAYARLSNIDEQNWSFATEVARAPISADGSIFRSDLELAVPPGLPPGVYQIDLGAFGRDGRPFGVRNMELVELLPTQGSVRVGPVEVRAGDPNVPGLEAASGAVYGERVKLESFGLSYGLNERRSAPSPINVDARAGLAAARAGDTLQIDMLWRSLVDHPGRYVVSATIEDERGFRWANRDSEPVDNLYPTWMWSAGEPIRDQLRMPVPAETPPGRYKLRLRVLEHDSPLTALEPGRSTGATFASLLDLDVLKTEAQPREREVAIADRRRQRVSEDLETIGQEIGRAEVVGGDPVDVQVVWRALRDIRRDFQARVTVSGRDGRPWAEVVEPLTSPGNPTSKWERGDIFRGQYRLRLNRAAGPGEGRVSVELIDGAGASAGRVDLGRVTVSRRPTKSDPGAARTQISATFGERISLTAFGVQPAGRLPAGRPTPVDVTLLWRAERSLDVDYTVFVQLLAPDGKLMAQHDGQPDDGLAITTTWERGVDIADTHRVNVPRDLPPGRYRLIAGLYDARDGQRLTVGDGGSFAQLAEIEIAR